MDNILLIASIIGALLLLAIISFGILKSRRENSDKDACNELDSAPDTNSLEDRNEYEKTVPLGISTTKDEYASAAEDAGPLEIQEVPKLSQVEKTEILRTVKKAGKPVVDKTEILVEKIKVAPKAILKYEENGQKTEYEMCSDLVNIGRDPEICDLVINGDNFLGKHHAMLFTRSDKFYLVDNNSKNGTYIEDEKVEGTIELKGSCRLKLAKTEIDFIIV
ncbi:FHA domain-containing protein [Lutispora sp.]|uniref:FHA domain-containing protein n=1 Tax=Lutispora sp. TaxID=2828727 RepID=UPI003563101B